MDRTGTNPGSIWADRAKDYSRCCGPDVGDYNRY
jgi:hypothetical protein